MKKLIVFLLLPLFVLNGTLAELGKIPELISHFKEHRAVNPAVDLSAFLHMHYFGDDQNSSDNDRDNELPFKKLSHSDAFDVQVIILADHFCSSELLVTEKNSALSHYNAKFAEPDQKGDRQPPKIG